MSTSSPKVWFITGCSTGFGRVLAEKALAAGAIVAATARSVDQLEPLRAQYPETCLPFALDVTHRGQVEEVVRQLLAKTGRIDVVVNNAGYGIIGALEETAEPQILQNFATIVFGAIHVIRAVLPTLRAQRSGRILNLSAAAAISNYAGFSIYGGAKFALEGISESLAAEVKPLGLKVCLIQPGPFRTDFISRSLDRAPQTIEDYAATSGKFAGFLQKMDGQQPGDPAKAAEAILKIAELENPPLRIPLGKYALDKSERVLKARQRELEQVKELNFDTEFN